MPCASRAAAGEAAVGGKADALGGLVAFGEAAAPGEAAALGEATAAGEALVCAALVGAGSSARCSPGQPLTGPKAQRQVPEIGEQLLQAQH